MVESAIRKGVFRTMLDIYDRFFAKIVKVVISF